MKIDIKKINENIEKCGKPPYCEVDEQDWRNALMGAQEAFSNTDIDEWNTEQYWEHIYFAAVYFCKGMMHAEIKAGLREETNYPTY